MKLDAESHTYRLAGRPGLEFVSCTEFIDRFFGPFRAREIANRLVEQSPKYRGRTVQSILDEWQQAAADGSRAHAEIEQALTSDRQPRSARAGHALTWLGEALPASHYEYLPERIVYSERLGLAGTVDLIARDRATGNSVLVDWKTNKKITREPFGGKQGIRGPARQLDDCHVVRYGLQLSLYHYLLETEYGIDPGKQLLVHLGRWGAEPIPCAYSRDTIEAMLEFEQHDGP
jgi:hypothetical protein